jgi:hypothetical protein
MSKLLEIIEKYNLNYTDKNTLHSYIPNLYDKLFESYKDKNNIVLEIGCREGHSLILWSEYFCNSMIYGIDNFDDVIFSNGAEKSYEYLKHRKNITTVIGNAYTEDIIKELPNIDILIDDGPHTIESQIECISLYYPKINEDGILIIEDVQSFSNLEKLENYAIAKYNAKVEKIDLRNVKDRYDDLVLVIRK